MKKRNLSQKQQKQLILIGICLVLLITAALYTALIKPRQSTDAYAYKEEIILRGDVIQGITETGQISLGKSHITYDINIETDEEDEDEDEDDDEEEIIHYLEIGEVFVVSGQRISEGDALFSITEKSYTAVEKNLSKAVTEKEIALAEAKASYDSDMLEAKSTYDTSMLIADSAGAVLNATTTQLNEEINGLTSQNALLQLEIEEYQEKLADEDFLESLNNAWMSYVLAKETFQETDPHSPAAYAANYSAYTSAKNQYESLLSQQEQWQNAITKNTETIALNEQKAAEKQSILSAKQADAQNSYELNIAQGELAEEIYSYTRDSLKKTVDSAQEEYDQALQTLEDLKSFLGEDGIIYADGSGLVTEVVYESGDELISAGNMLTYIKEGSYTVSVDVSEEDIAGISIGDSVRVAFSAYPDAEYTGTVQSLTTTKTSDYANTVSYPVTILIEGDTSELYGGMTAEITFVNEMVSDVLYVSRKAIVTENDKTFVYTGEGKEKELKEVTTGFENSTQVEITSGLSEGDIIYIRSAIGGTQ